MRWVSFGQGCEQDGEFVVGDVGDHVVFAQAGVQDAADLAQHRFAGGVAVQVLDRFDAVQGDEHQGAVLAGEA